MGLHRIKRGLRLPILGEPNQEIEAAKSPRRVALLGADYVGMRPTLQVRVGDTVRRGQLLFEDKKMPGVRFTSPAAGRVTAVNRGDKRAFQSVVIELSRAEIEGRAGAAEATSLSSYTGSAYTTNDGVIANDYMIQSAVGGNGRLRFGGHGRFRSEAHYEFVDTDEQFFASALIEAAISTEIEALW